MKNKKQAPTQLSFARCEFAWEKHATYREKFLAGMEQVRPWARLGALIGLAYHPSGHVGRQQIGIACLLRAYLLLQWFGLANKAVENAIDGSRWMRGFVRRHRLSMRVGAQRHDIAEIQTPARRTLSAAQLFGDIPACLSERGPLPR